MRCNTHILLALSSFSCQFHHPLDNDVSTVTRSEATNKYNTSVIQTNSSHCQYIHFSLIQRPLILSMLRNCFSYEFGVIFSLRWLMFIFVHLALSRSSNYNIGGVVIKGQQLIFISVIVTLTSEPQFKLNFTQPLTIGYPYKSLLQRKNVLHSAIPYMNRSLNPIVYSC